MEQEEGPSAFPTVEGVEEFGDNDQEEIATKKKKGKKTGKASGGFQKMGLFYIAVCVMTTNLD